ncbi:hypothetical protein [Acinetobacter sp. P1(2025)]|uniref:hypothetical protein n=1 Tax=Acinetobacter sp. P1(2025) TaxID=3446120 RepID=UPI003F53630A
MNANELYEKLKKIGKPIIHVDSVEATMNMDISIEELDKHIEILGVHFLLVEILKVDSNDLFSKENKSYIDDYINQNIDDKKTILSIKEKKPTDIGMVSIGFNLNGCVLAFTHIDEWMEHLIQLAKFISDKRESEDSNNYWEEQNKIREQKFLEKQEKEKEKEDMIQRVEELTNCDRFQNFKTKGEMLLFWENNIPDLYKTLSRTFMEKMARKYISIVRGS